MNKIFKVIPTVVFIFLIGGAIFIYLKQPAKQNTVKVTGLNEKKETSFYESDTYGYKFSYPAQFDLIKISEELQTIIKKNFSSSDPQVYISLIKDSSADDLQSFEEFVLDEARIICSSDTPEVSVLCTRIDDVVKIAPFSSKSGVAGQVFYLRGEEKNKKTGETKNIKRGPIYTFNTSSLTPNSMSFLLIANPFSKSPDDANLSLIMDVAGSLYLPK